MLIPCTSTPLPGTLVGVLQTRRKHTWVARVAKVTFSTGAIVVLDDKSWEFFWNLTAK